MDALRIMIVQAGVTTRRGGEDQKNRGIVVIDPDDIESISTQPGGRTGFRTRSGDDYVSPMEFEPFLCWLSEEIRQREAKEIREAQQR